MPTLADYYLQFVLFVVWHHKRARRFYLLERHVIHQSSVNIIIFCQHYGVLQALDENSFVLVLSRIIQIQH